MGRIEKLPEPAATTWRRLRHGLKRAIQSRIPEFAGWKLSGGTILAAQWGHRESTDIDLRIPPKSGLRRLEPRYDPGFNREMAALGAGEPSHRENQIIIPAGEGKIDLFEADSTPGEGEYSATIHGIDEIVLSNAQILAGKLIGRGFESPSRDLFDIAVAADTDPQALEVAVNCISEPTWQETRVRWRENAAMHVARAREGLRGVAERWADVAADPADAAIQRATKARYSVVRIQWWADELTATTECAGGACRRHRIPTGGQAAVRRELERLGLNAYLDATGTTSARAVAQDIERMRTTGAGTVYESSAGGSAAQAPVRAASGMPAKAHTPEEAPTPARGTAAGQAVPTAPAIGTRRPSR